MKKQQRKFTVLTGALIKPEQRAALSARCAEMRVSPAPQDEALRLGFKWVWLDTVNHRAGVAVWNGVEVMLGIRLQTTDIEKEYLSGCLVPTSLHEWKVVDLISDDGATTQALRDRVAELQTELEHARKLLAISDKLANIMSD